LVASYRDAQARVKHLEVMSAQRNGCSQESLSDLHSTVGSAAVMSYRDAQVCVEHVGATLAEQDGGCLQENLGSLHSTVGFAGSIQASPTQYQDILAVMSYHDAQVCV